MVVTYNIGEEYAGNFASYIDQVDKVVIVDNGSDRATQRVLRQLHDAYPKKTVVMVNHKNLGLAAAQNMGLRQAVDEGFDWVLLFDHDSRAEPDMVAQMAAVVQHHPAAEKIGIVAPYFWEEVTQKPARYVTARNKVLFVVQRFRADKFALRQRKEKRARAGRVKRVVHQAGRWMRKSALGRGVKRVCARVVAGVQRVLRLGLPRFRQQVRGEYMDGVLAVIASGSLLRAAMVRDIGMMREDFFIDYIDSEYCLRARRKGWNVVVARRAVLHHALGEKKRHTRLNMTVVTSNHSAARRYTIYRNRIWVWRMYYSDAFPYVLFDMIAVTFDMWRIALLEQERFRKLRAVLRGVYDGFWRKKALMQEV